MWKDILYGSDKEWFWYADPALRCCLDFQQGGAMLDLRPYIARIEQKTGIGTENVYDASYPYLIQANYRAGSFTHYKGEGTIKSCKIHYKGQTVDLCMCRTMATYERLPHAAKVVSDPVTVQFDGLEVVIRSTFIIEDGTGVITTVREILNDLHGETVELEEYFTGGFGTTEYQPPMNKIVLGIDGERGKHMRFSYKDRAVRSLEKDAVAFVAIPDVNTRLEMSGDADVCEAKEGIAFSPIYKLMLRKKLSKGGFSTWLKLASMD